MVDGKVESFEIDESETLTLTADSDFEGEIVQVEKGKSSSGCFRLLLLVGVVGCVIVVGFVSFHAMADTVEQDPPFDFSVCVNPMNETTLEGFAQHVLEDPNHCNADCPLPLGNCTCLNPVIPDTNEIFYGGLWTQAFESNLLHVNDAPADLDVIFYGDSITEHWAGFKFGLPDDKWAGNKEVFDQLFTKAGGGPVEGLALGISADRCNNLLYRIQNGELPQHVNPKVIWVLIGTNDIGTCCSTKGAIASTIATLEEIRRRKPKATIVVNSLLPRPLRTYLWRELTKINHALECYTHGKANMEFFNATSIFVTTSQDDEDVLNDDFLPDKLHPNKEGSLHWGRAILAKLRKILKK